jgi:osmotically-inducible protein OsmY
MRLSPVTTSNDEVNHMRKVLLAATAAALGAVAGILLDPARGRARRARAVDQSVAMLRHGRRSAGRYGRRILSRIRGSVTALRAGNDRTAAGDDATLKSRVESELFGSPEVPKGAININAEQGIVVLRGEVADDATRALLADRAAAVRGVWYVENLLHLPGEPALTRR